MRTSGIFYFPWHRHQIEGTNGFYCLIRKTLASGVNGIAKVPNRKVFTEVGLEPSNVRSPVDALTHSAIAHGTTSWVVIRCDLATNRAACCVYSRNKKVVIAIDRHTRDGRPIYPMLKSIKISLILASDWSSAIKIVINIDGASCFDRPSPGGASCKSVFLYG